MKPGHGLRRLRAAALVVAAVLVLGATTRAYLQPGFAVDLANRVWSCF